MSVYGPSQDLHVRTDPSTGERHLVSMRLQRTLCHSTNWIGWSIYHGPGTPPGPLCPTCYSQLPPDEPTPQATAQQSHDNVTENDQADNTHPSPRQTT